MPTAAPFLMFQGGVARQAIEFYVSLFDDGEILLAEDYGPGQPGPEGTLLRARFRVAGQEFHASDSPVTHQFEFTPSLSIWVEADSAEQQDALFAALADGGQVLMPLDGYGFSTRFGWTNDRFGVSWQVNLA